MYREFNKLSQVEKEIINSSLKNVECSHALIDNIKRNILCLTNAGLIILWGVLQDIRHRANRSKLYYEVKLSGLNKTTFKMSDVTKKTWTAHKYKIVVAEHDIFHNRQCG